MRLHQATFEQVKYGIEHVFDNYTPKYLSKAYIKKVFADKRKKLLEKEDN